MMKISLITPTFNSANTIAGHLDSVLFQDFGPIERIFVDNKSTDQTLNIIREKYQKLNRFDEVKIISEKDKGISDAFNKGIRASSGEIVGILNSDDLLLGKDVLSIVSKIFEANPELDFVHGDVLYIDEVYGTNVRQPLLCPLDTASMPLNHPGMFIRKSLYEKIGPYSEDFKYAMDFEWTCRLYKNSKEMKFLSHYYNEKPFVEDHAGGASWLNEMATLDEVKKALVIHGYYNLRAKIYFNIRKLRSQLKSILLKTGSLGLVKLWRKFKWQ